MTLAANVFRLHLEDSMKKKTLALLAVIIAAVATRAEPPAPTELLPELRKGGYVLFIRHPKTNPDQADTDPLNLENVKAQRHLSDDGRKQAKALGDAFRALKIPVEKWARNEYNVTSAPSNFLLDTEGRIIFKPRANYPTDVRDFEKQIELVLARRNARSVAATTTR